MQKLNRTPIGKKYHSAIVTVNDAMCFTAFLHEGFQQEAKKCFRGTDARLASEAFPEKTIAKRIDFKLVPLLEMQSKTLGWHMDHGVMIATEYALNYCLEALKRIGEFGPILPPIDTDLGPEERLSKAIEGSSNSTDFAKFFQTLTYFRHVRNYFAHARDKPHQIANSFWKQHANGLNSFWHTRPITLNRFNFREPIQDPNCFENSIDQINIVGICLREIDTSVAANLPTNEVMREEIKDFIHNQPSLKGDHARLARKVCKNILMRYGSEIDQSKINACIIEYFESS